MEVKCTRCGKKLEEKKYLIQAIVYLGVTSERLPICDKCFSEFTTWLNHPVFIPKE